MIFEIVGSAIKLVTRQFFRRIQISGAEIELKRPVIFAANHHNQAVDSFVMGAVVDRELYFIAKSTLFGNPLVALFLKSMHMLPIYRKSDNADMSKNHDTFAAVCERLHAGKAILIFPEGTSTERRVLLPLKTGAARIALQAYREQPQADICIQPVSITYENIYEFQSSVTITFAEPITVQTFFESSTDVEAVNKLTDFLEQELRKITVHIEHEIHQPLVETISSLFTESDDERKLFSRVTKAVEIAVNVDDPEVHKVFQHLKDLRSRRNRQYVFEIDNAGVSPVARLFWLPAIVIGLTTNFVPYQLVKMCVKRLVSDRHNLASVKIGISILIFPVWYLLLFFVSKVYLGALWAAGGLLTTLVCGWIVKRKWALISRWLRKDVNVAQQSEELLTLRNQLLDLEARIVK